MNALDGVIKKALNEVLTGLLLFASIMLIFILGYFTGVARTETEYHRVEQKAKELEQMRAVVTSNFFYNLQDTLKKHEK